MEETFKDANELLSLGDMSLLCIACYYKNLKTCEWLIKKGANVNMVIGNSSPLHMAVRFIEGCKLLLRNNANINIVNASVRISIYRLMKKG